MGRCYRLDCRKVVYNKTISLSHLLVCELTLRSPLDRSLFRHSISRGPVHTVSHERRPRTWTRADLTTLDGRDLRGGHPGSRDSRVHIYVISRLSGSRRTTATTVDGSRRRTLTVSFRFLVLFPNVPQRSFSYLKIHTHPSFKTENETYENVSHTPINANDLDWHRVQLS